MSDLNLKNYRISLIVLIFILGTIGGFVKGETQLGTSSVAIGLLVSLWLTFRFNLKD